MGHLAEVQAHSGFPGSIKNLLQEFETRIAALEAEAKKNVDMLTELRAAWESHKAEAPAGAGDSSQ